MRVVQHPLALVGDTPLIRLDAVEPAGRQLFGKAEHMNPGGSVKDRICLAMIEDAERRGALRPGQTVVEPTSGNTGIGLAWVCAVKGYPLVLTMPASMSLERRQLLEAFGARIILTDPERVMEGAIEAAVRVAQEKGAYMPQQFKNAVNPQVHETTTATEIVDAIGYPDAFVAAVGTGGTVSGVGRAMKRAQASTLVVAVEPAASAVLSGGARGPSKIQGIGAGFVPENYDPSVVDRVERVEDQAAMDMKRRLARRAGILVGISAGANVVAAARVAERLPDGAVVVTILCDTGERYFSLDEYFP